jgi:hypothetical protein
MHPDGLGHQPGETERQTLLSRIQQLEKENDMRRNEMI